MPHNPYDPSGQQAERSLHAPNPQQAGELPLHMDIIHAWYMAKPSEPHPH